MCGIVPGTFTTATAPAASLSAASAKCGKSWVRPCSKCAWSAPSSATRSVLGEAAPLHLHPYPRTQAAQRTPPAGAVGPVRVRLSVQGDPHQRQALRAQAPSTSQRARRPGGDLRGAEIPKRRWTTCRAIAVAPIKPGRSRRSWRTISTASCRCRPTNPSAAPPNNAPPGGRSCAWAPAERYAMASSMSRLASSRGMTGFNFNCGRQLSALCGLGCEAS